jgi:hypothetical protein
LSGVSRASYYRHFAPKAAKRDDADLRDLIQRIALDNFITAIAASPPNSGVKASWSTPSGCCAWRARTICSPSGGVRSFRKRR